MDTGDERKAGGFLEEEQTARVAAVADDLIRFLAPGGHPPGEEGVDAFGELLGRSMQRLPPDDLSALQDCLRQPLQQLRLATRAETRRRLEEGDFFRRRRRSLKKKGRQQP